MDMSEKDIIRNSKISKRRNELTELFIEYRSIDSTGNSWQRFKENSNIKDIIFFLLKLFVIAFISLIGPIFILDHPILVFIILPITLILGIGFFNNEEKKFIGSLKKINDARDKDFCELLRKKGVDSTNIKDVIDYFVLELEPVDIVYKESLILNSVSKFGSNLFFLLLGIIIPSIIKENAEQNGVQTYAFIIAFLVIIVSILAFIKILTLINRKDPYLYKIRKLVIDLKQIDLLNKLD